MTAETSNARGEWVLVPREPTEAMLDAMHSRIRILCDPAARTADIQNDREVWAAMLAVSPPAPISVPLDRLTALDGLVDRIAEAIRDGDGLAEGDPPWERLGAERRAPWRADAKRALSVIKESLTAETRTPPPAAARGDVPYDRELIAQMLDAAEAPAFTMEEMDTQARLLREAAQAKPEARGVVDVKPVGTITRRDSGDEVIEHRIALDPGFEESLYRYPAGTVIHLYAEAAADVALAHVQAAAAALAETRNVR